MASVPSPPLKAHTPKGTGSGRNIVLLLDGTGNQFGTQNSNVIKLRSICQADETQLVYYSSGLGTILPPGASAWGELKQKIALVLDKGLAINFETFVCDAYRYLMDYYQDGDQIYIFGFSRGSYEARALAGMIQKVGLLPPGNYNQVELAWALYKDFSSQIEGEVTPPSWYQKVWRKIWHSKVPPLPEGETLSMMYRRMFGLSRDVSVHFIGVWDTVSSLAALRAPRLPFATGVGSVLYFRQALALDERRVKFAPEYRHIGPADQDYPDDPREGPAHPRLTQSQECWFMGCHSDVGGGNTLNNTVTLSNIPFRWMVREALSCGLKLEAQSVVMQPALASCAAVLRHKPILIPQELRDLIDGQRLGTAAKKDEYKNSKRIEELLASDLGDDQLKELVQVAAAGDADASDLNADVLSDKHESLKGFLYWMLEYWNIKTRWYTGNSKDPIRDHWIRKRGDGRQMNDDQFIHVSVKNRMLHDRQGNNAARKKPYTPTAHLSPLWHDAGWEDLIDKAGEEEHFIA